MKWRQSFIHSGIDYSGRLLDLNRQSILWIYNINMYISGFGSNMLTYIQSTHRIIYLAQIAKWFLSLFFKKKKQKKIENSNHLRSVNWFLTRRRDQNVFLIGFYVYFMDRAAQITINLNILRISFRIESGHQIDFSKFQSMNDWINEQWKLKGYIIFGWASI